MAVELCNLTAVHVDPALARSKAMHANDRRSTPRDVGAYAGVLSTVQKFQSLVGHGCSQHPCCCMDKDKVRDPEWENLTQAHTPNEWPDPRPPKKQTKTKCPLCTPGVGFSTQN